MNATLFSLVSLVLAFSVLVFWAFSSRTQERWDAAKQLPFNHQDVVDPEDEQ